MKPYLPEQIFVERSVRHSRITRHVLQRLPGVRVEEIDSSDVLLERSRQENPSLVRAKKSLILARHKGRFFKPCPAGQTRGSTRNACCNYFVINYASNCHMECSYCYLQAYLNFPYLILYANLGELLAELDSVLVPDRSRYFRVGTGELADSLALDELSGYSTPLVEYFSRQPNAVLEFKTKSNCVDGLLGLNHCGRTVVSWSLNPRSVQKQEEHKTATIDERLAAARRCVAAGYPVAFHLDPMIHYDGWADDYRDLVQEIFQRVPAESVLWISLGTLRMTTALKDKMRERFPSSTLPLGELVPTGDGKLRYFKSIRIEMYRRVEGWIRAGSRRTAVYACMEKAEVWNRAFGAPPPSEQVLGDSLVQLV